MIARTVMNDAAVPLSTTRDALPEWPGWIPLALFVGAALWFRTALQPWLVMVTMFFGLYAGFKWQALWDAWRGARNPSLLRAAGYLFLSGGVDARAFLEPQAPIAQPTPREWIAAYVKMLAGVALLYGGARHIYAVEPFLGAWSGLIGGVLIAHFGSFHLLALVWRCAGINAQFVMNQPMRSTSLTDLWGKRWNAPFRDMMHAMVFRPLSPRVGPTKAMLAVFLVSGFAHELVISIPAGGAYGLPTLYFLLQGCGVMTERSRFGRKRRIGSGWRGWVFTFVVAAVPAVWLFNPPFLFNVAVPLLKFVSAL